MMLVMMRMLVSLQHLQHDPVGLVYTPVIFSLICMYFTQYLLPRVRISCCSIMCMMMIYNFFQIANT